MWEKWDVKLTKKYIFQDRCYTLYDLFLLFILGYELNFHNVIAITFHIFNYFQDYFGLLKFTDRFSSLHH